MTVQRCEICDSDAAPDGGLVTFLPRASDVQWRESRLENGYVGHPPDAAWLCRRHLAAGRELASTLTIDVALAGLRDRAALVPILDRARAAPRRITIQMWERILRRALPDLAVEMGLSDLDLEYVAQESCEPMQGLAPDVDPWPWGQQWSLSGAAGTVCLYSDAVHHPSGVLVRKVVVLMVSPKGGERYEVEVVNSRGCADVDPQAVRIEGRPSDVCRELLESFVTGSRTARA